MPRETIVHWQEAADTENTGEAARNGLDVSWSREGDQFGGMVQIGLDMPLSVLRDIRRELDADEKDPVSVVARALYTPSLDRRELNHLIRTLRRARDAAYGSDE